MTAVAVLAMLLGGSGVPVAADDGLGWPPAVGGTFESVAPARVLDTRRAGQGPCVSGTRLVAMPDVPGDAAAVVLNVTVTGAKAPGYVTVHAAGSSRPGTSSVNFVAGRTVENSVVSRLGSGGVAVFASGGCPHVVVDVAGYFEGGAPARGGAFSATTPSRLVDTRRAGQGPCVSGTRTVAVPDVPAGAAGVVLNVTVTGAKAPGYVTVHGAGSSRPATSSVNYVAAATVANGVTSAVGTAGLSVFASGGCPHVIVDLVGWFTGEGPVLEGSFAPIAPSRLLDTRRAGQGPCVSGARTVAVPGVPAGVTGAVLNVTVTGSKAPGYVQAYAAGASRPATSVLNFSPGQTVANGATTAVGAGGITVFASGGCPHVIVDLVGYYSGEPEPLTGVVDISVGATATCALIDDGTIRCWGAGDQSNLGNPTPGHSPFPLPVVGIADAVSLDAGMLASCAVLADTTVTCWGWDFESPFTQGQLATPVPGLSGVIQVSVGQSHACALLADDTVWCWGDLHHLQLAAGEHGMDPVEVPGLTDVVEISAGFFHLCARRGDGTVVCRGNDLVIEDDSYEVPDLDDAVSITAGDMHTCAVREDRTAWCWGYLAPLNGIASGVIAVTPTQILDVDDVEQLGGANTGRCALHGTGAVSCFGVRDVAEALDVEPDWAPVTIPGLSGVVKVDAGWRTHGCALLEDGTVRCWGRRLFTGDGTLDDAAVPVTVIAGIAP